MAISYPLALPTNIGMASIELRAKNTVAVSMSPFTYKQQTQSYDGEMWEADISLPPMNRDDAETWISFLMSLKVMSGTFLLNDPSAKTVRGTATSAVITGAVGASSVGVVMTGTLKAGDYIQLGTASTSKLHKVLADVSATGSVDIWPNLKATYSSAAVVVDNAKGVFRLTSNVQDWQIGNSSTYGISFEAVEVIT